ncbi:hypothetical protein RhiLY_05963 [Ceratobasidium sp. AG-Ba]|nr:hypothetical protein RhiLY_05963 [Ceratobasidium sp. AG-Ba]
MRRWTIRVPALPVTPAYYYTLDIHPMLCSTPNQLYLCSNARLFHPSQANNNPGRQDDFASEGPYAMASQSLNQRILNGHDHSPTGFHSPMTITLPPQTPSVLLPRVRELEFKLSPRDIRSVCMAVLALVMEPGDEDEDRNGGPQCEEYDEDMHEEYEYEFREYERESEMGDAEEYGVDNTNTVGSWRRNLSLRALT